MTWLVHYLNILFVITHDDDGGEEGDRVNDLADPFEYFTCRHPR